jgi:hypothetical protein
MNSAADNASYENLVKKLKTKPFDPEAPVIPARTSYEAVIGIGNDLASERDAEAPLRNAHAQKMWEGT